MFYRIKKINKFGLFFITILQAPVGQVSRARMFLSRRCGWVTIGKSGRIVYFSRIKAYVLIIPN